ncbi:MAG: TIGR04282 family arsenosugar biosynthesis glycosyltransferase [Bacteroidota bacterium]
MKEALIIFVRHPQLGKVKTRLAATIGNDAALNIYKKLLQHTLEISKKTEATIFVFYADEIVEDDIWQEENFFKLLQAEGDLGQKMLSAFTQVFASGCDKVCIIGSDCYELTETIIADAFTAMNEVDVAIGPANDGGYYLLGMKQLHHSIFENKQWSTRTVFDETIHSIMQAKLSYKTLATLTDVDEEKDLPNEWRLR